MVTPPTTPASIPDEAVSVGSNLPFGLENSNPEDTMNALDALHVGLESIGSPEMDKEGKPLEGELDRIEALQDELVGNVSGQVDASLDKNLSGPTEYRAQAEESAKLNGAMEVAEKIGTDVHDKAGVDLADSEVSGPQANLDTETVDHSADIGQTPGGGK